MAATKNFDVLNRKEGKDIFKSQLFFSQIPQIIAEKNYTYHSTIILMQRKNFRIPPVRDRSFEDEGKRNTTLPQDAVSQCRIGWVEPIKMFIKGINFT